VIFAILPLSCTTDGKLVKAFNDSLCLQLCSTLVQLNQVSVIAYQAIKNLPPDCIDLKELSALIGFNHIVTGGTQYAKQQLRINVQIIDIRTYKQIWSNIYKYNIAATNFLDILDEICAQTGIQAQSLVNKF
jgi:TolB-like protein